MSVAVLAALLVGLASSAIAAELSETGEESFADIAACAASGDHLLAAIIVDSSGSLRQTDPEDQRVGAILLALDSLEQLGRSSGEALEVRANLATFGGQYQELVGWGTVAGGHLAELRASAERTLPSRDSDQFTDYRAALRGAQDSLNRDAATLEGESCKIVLWFTDGRLDVGPQTGAVAAELCSPQGIADSLRGDRIAVIALALFTEGGRGSVTDGDRERLRATAEGIGAGETCGTIPAPQTSSNGAYLRAGDAGAMRRLFAQAAAMIEGATPGLSFTCPDQSCQDGLLNVPIDEGVGGVRIILERDQAAAPPTLTAADGSAAELKAGLSSLGGASLAVTDRDGLMTVDVSFDGAGSPGGSWTLANDPKAATLVDLYYFWGITLAIEAGDGLLVGEIGTVRVVPRTSDGNVVSFEGFADADVLVRIDGVDRPARVIDDAWEVQMSVPSTDVAPSLRVEATARATSSPNGIKLGPVTASTDLTTNFPPSFPTITPSVLNLSSITGDGVSTGALTFIGSARGSTRACVEPAQAVKGPSGAGTISITADAECIDIPADGRVTINVNVVPENPADGRVDGVLPIRLEGVDASDPVTVNIPVSLSMSRPVDEATRWALVALFILLALALAWLTAEISRRVGDRYLLSTDARVASVPVIISAAGVRRVGRPASPSLLDPAFDFVPVGIDRKRRMTEFSAGGLHFGRSFPVYPLNAGIPWVRDSDGGIVISSGDAAMREDRSQATAKFPGSVGHVFVMDVLRADSEESEISGRLVIVVDSADGVSAVIQDRVHEIRDGDWDGIITAVHAASAARLQKSPRTANPGADTASPAAAEPDPARTPQKSDWDADLPRDTAATPERARRSRLPRPSRTKPDKAQGPEHSDKQDPGRSSIPPRSPLNFWD